jgi:hypothetical protein
MDHLLHLMTHLNVLRVNKPTQFDRVIIFSFHLRQDADNWWNDDGLPELSKHRRASTEITASKSKRLDSKNIILLNIIYIMRTSIIFYTKI